MIHKETAEPVVQYLRTLTYDGELSAEEIWQLADWLNQQPKKILQSWPAKELVNALQAAFADNTLTTSELEELAHIIVAIEELWMTSGPRSLEERPSEEIGAGSGIVEEPKPAAPTIPITAEVPDQSRDDSLTVDLQHHTCTCPDWIENREAFPEGDFRRLCSHLAGAFHSLCDKNEELRRDPLFVAFINENARRNKGTDIDNVWHAVVINGVRLLYGASPTSEWVNVFAPAEGSYKRFGYNRRKQRWAYGDRPAEVAWLLGSLFSPAHPQALTSRA